MNGDGAVPIREVLTDPRLKPPTPPAMSYEAALKDAQTALMALGKAVIAAHHRIFPVTADIRYTVTQRNGRVKVKWEPMDTREQGYTDA